MATVTALPRTAPHNPEAEATVLGAVLENNDFLGPLVEHLTPKHFYDARHRLVFESIVSMYERSEHLDLVTLKGELGDRLAEAGGAAYLAGLIDGVPRFTSIEHWIKLIQREANRRAILNLTAKAQSATWNDTEPVEVIEQLVLSLQKVSEMSSGTAVRPIRVVVSDAIRQIDDFVSSPSGITGVPTGLPDLDRITRGMRVGLWVIAARSGRGKSALAGQIAVHAATKGFRVLMFAMEMPDVDVVERMIFGESEVDAWDLKHNDRDGEKMGRVIRAGTKLGELPIKFDSHETPRLAHVKAVARQEKAKGLDLIIVDHLQRMTVEKTEEGNWLAVGANVQGLKSLSMALRVPVLATCQLTGDAEDKKRPTLADLAQARQIIAAEADLIGILHPEHSEDWRKHDFPTMNLFIDKQRQGPMGEIPLSFERSKSRFVCLAKNPSAEEWSAK